MRTLLRIAAALAAVWLALALALAAEGLRAGGWQPGRVPAALVLAVLAAGAAAFPAARTASPAGPGALALGLLLSLAGLCGLLVARSPAGISGRVALDIRRVAAGDSRTLALPLDQVRTPARAAQTLGRRGDLAIAASGVVFVPEAGRYLFRVDCGGRCRLLLGDGDAVLAEGRLEHAADLPQGPVPFTVGLGEAAPRAYVRIDWVRPAFFESTRFADWTGPPGTAGTDLRGAEARALRRSGTGAVLLLLAGVCLAGLLRAGAESTPGAIRGVRRRLGDPAVRDAWAAGAAALALIGLLHAWAAPRALPGGYLHGWTSEYMMQTLSVADLRAEPVRSLVYLHVQPPLLDALRALLAAAQGGTDGDAALMRAVDRGLYRVWAFAYAALTALAALWLGTLHGRGAAWAGAAVLALHPAVLFYATFLDSTFLSALLVLWLVFELWRFGPGDAGSIPRLAAAVLALFFTRSIVQWPFLAVLAAALVLRGGAAGRVARTLGLVALVMALFLAKQHALFGVTLTSTFGPDSFCKGLSAYCPGTAAAELPRPLPPPEAASALRRTEKLNGEYNYNQLAFVRRSFAQMVEYRALVRSLGPAEMVRLLAHNVRIWFRPSSRHSPHALVDALPWREPFDVLLSGLRLAALLLAAAGLWMVRVRRNRPALLGGLGLALPVLYFAAVSIVFESGENMRYKFFVEPVLVVFFASEAAGLAQGFRRQAAEGGRIQPPDHH